MEAGDLPNFHEVHPYLYRGGQPTPEGLKKLKGMGVSTIIDLRNMPEQIYDERSEAHALGMKYINLPMGNHRPSKDLIKVFLDETDRAKKAGSSAPVFVHCHHGADRTGCLIGIWRVTRDDYSFDAAYREMRKYYFKPRFTILSDTVRDCAKPAATPARAVNH